MKTSFLSFLGKPYALSFNKRKVLRTALFVSLFIFLFIVVFLPFGLAGWEGNVYPVAAGYGICTLTAMLCLNLLLPRLLRSYFDEDRWTVGRELFWSVLNIAVIGIVNALFSAAIGFGRISLRQVLLFEFYTLAVGIIPLSLLILFRQSRKTDEEHKKAERINSALNTPGMSRAGDSDTKVLIRSSTDAMPLELSLKDLVYMESSDNYVEVYHLIGNDLVKTLVRNSLKSLAADLAPHTSLLRCHKSYMVNLARVIHVTGNAQGFKLHLKGVKKLIPVSRAYNHLVRRGLIH